jgi:hypothetical protein
MTGSGAIGTTHWRITDADFTRADGFILVYASGGIRTNIWPMYNNIPVAAGSASWPGGINPVLTPSGGWDTIVFTTAQYANTFKYDATVAKRDTR